MLGPHRRLHFDAVLVDGGDHRSRSNMNAKAVQRRERLFRKVFGERAEDAIAGFHQRDARFGGIDLTEVVL
jgi:hypothetical protein